MTTMRRIGSSLATLALGVASFSSSVHAQRRTEAPHAVVAGTVFHQPGFALAGARVVLTSIPDSGSSTKPVSQKAVTGERGEFAFRLPPTEAHYKISVSAKHFAGQEKTVEVRGEEQVETTFLLEPAN